MPILAAAPTSSDAPTRTTEFALQEKPAVWRASLAASALSVIRRTMRSFPSEYVQYARTLTPRLATDASTPPSAAGLLPTRTASSTSFLAFATAPPDD